MKKCSILLIISLALLLSSLPLNLFENNNGNNARISPGENETNRVTDNGAVITRGDLQLEIRSMTDEEIDNIIASGWVSREGVNYNRIIDGHGTGLKPPSEEDWKRIAKDMIVVESVKPLKRGGFAASVDHSSSIYFPPIGNQDGEGSCTCWSVGYYIKTFQEATEHNWDLSGASWVGGYKGNPTPAYQDRIMSPDFIYHQVNDGVDMGSSFEASMDLCNVIGACSWKEMPYNPDDSDSWPPENAWREAPWYRTNEGYQMLDLNGPGGIESLKAWLDAGNLAGTAIDANQYNVLDGNDLWKNDTYTGGGENHANTIIGYDDDFGPYTENGQARKGAFKIANSWGTGWTGDHNGDGMYWISYECMKWEVMKPWGHLCYFFDDMIDYEPELLSVFDMTHTKRGECRVSVGIGDPSNPKKVKDFDSWPGGADGGDHPYPSNMMAMDITELMDAVTEINGSQLFIKVNDTESVTVGSIDSFSVEYYGDYSTDSLYINATSSDPVVNTIQGSTVNASLILEDIIPPTADAGEDQTVGVGATVDFDGTNSTDNSAVNNYTWNFSYDGQERILYGFSPNYTFNICGSYIATLNVTDPSGNWGTDAMTVHVVDLTKPVADAGVSQFVDQGDTVNFDGSASYDDVGIINYTWNFTYNGMGVLLYDVSPVFTFDIVGSYLVTLNVTDNPGNWDTDSMTVTVNDTEAPVFDTFWHGPLSPGETAFFSANITDNAGMNTVMFDYSINNGSRYNRSVTNSTGDSWDITISLPGDTSYMEYYFWAEDTSNNGVKSNNLTIGVNDNDDPVFGTVWHSALTTGDAALFSANVTDNAGVNTVKFDFTMVGASRHNWSVTNNTGDSWEITIALSSSAASIEYYFWAEDGAFNSVKDANATPAVSDNDEPALVGDNSPDSGTTGDVFSFDINTTDNIGVTGVNISWNHGALNGNKGLADDGDGTWSGNIVLDHDVGDLTYYIQINDSAGNTYNGDVESASVADDDDPGLTSDDSSDSSGTGDVFTFDINTSDNIGVAGVNVSWDHGALNGNEVLNDDSDGTWSGTIILDHNITDLTYFIQIDDGAGNTYNSGMQTVTVSDNDDPVLAGDNSPDSGGTGDIFIFDIDTADNIGVTGVNVSWNHGGSGGNEQLNDDGDGTWSGSVTLEHNTTDMTYYIQINDSVGNSFNSGLETVSVNDNDDPTLTSDDSPDSCTTNDGFTFDVDPADNILVAGVNISWSHGVLSGNKALADDGDGTWSGTIILDHNVTDLVYYIQINDTGGNSYNSDLETVTVTDNDAPEFGVFWNSTLTTGDETLFSFNVTDFIGIDQVKFDFIINGVFHHNWSVTNNTGDSWYITVAFPTYGTSIEYYLWANDTSGNGANSTNLTRNILDNDPPTVDAGPDIVIDQHETVNFDSGGCGDNVAVDNYTWNFTYAGVCNHLYDSYPSFTFHFAGNFTILLRVSDTAGNWAEDVLVVRVNDITPPVTDAGHFQAVNQHTWVSLNGSNSTDNVGIVNYTWTFHDNDTVQTIYGVIAGYLFDNAGLFNITLRAGDAAGNSFTDNVEVMVNDTTPPLAAAGRNITVEQHQYVNFDAGGSSDNVGIHEYEWNITFIDSFVLLTGVNASHQFHQSGVFTVNLTVADLRGNRDFDTMTVTVIDVTKPVAAAGRDISIDQHERVTFNAEGSSDNDGIANFTWIFEYVGNTRAFIHGNEPLELYGMIVSFMFHDAGIYIITLRVADTMGLNDTDNITVKVKDITPPIADAGSDITADQGEKVTLDAGGSSDNVGIVDYEWSFELDGKTIILQGKNPVFTFESVGEYSVELNVSDSVGNWNADTVMIKVEDTTPPTVKAGPDVTIEQYVKILFLDYLEYSDPDGIALYRWDFKYDGTLHTLDYDPLLPELPYHTFEIPGRYAVTLTVSDGQGNQASDIFNITVLDTIRPMANAGKDIRVSSDGTVKFDASGSSDNAGITSYTWTFKYGGEVVTLYGSDPDFRFEREGVYDITLNVTDEAGNHHEDHVSVEVVAPHDTKGESDAEKLMRSAGMWILGIVLLLIVFLVLFFVFRRKKDDERTEVKKEEMSRPPVEIEKDTMVVCGPVGPQRRRTGAGKGKRAGRSSPPAKGKATFRGRQRGTVGDRRRRKSGKEKGGRGGKGRARSARKRRKNIRSQRSRGRRREEERRKMAKEEISVRLSTLTGRTRGETKEDEMEPEAKEEYDSWDEDEWAVKISRYGDGPELDGLEEYSPFADWDEEEDEMEEEREEEEEEEGEYECPDCGASLHEEDNICPSCGAEFEEEGVEGDETEIGGEVYGEVGIVEFTGGRYAGEQEVDFIIDMSYFEFDEEDLGYECSECGATMGAEDTACPDCGIDFDSEEYSEVWGE